MNLIDRLRHHRRLLLPGLVALLCLAMLVSPPISQPPDYHDWADQRGLWGIPNAGDVISNLGFLLVGLYGLFSLYRGQCCCRRPGETLAWSLLFFGVCLTALGSSIYHWTPDNHTLLWDRLPMAWSFMALLAALLIERGNPRLGIVLLPVLIVLGLVSVMAWYASETAGNSDLRPYLLAQGGTLVLIPALLLLYRPVYDLGHGYLVALALYLLALLAEWLDAWLFSLTGLISGHSIKHLIAALAIYWLLRMLRRRKPLITRPD